MTDSAHGSNAETMDVRAESQSETDGEDHGVGLSGNGDDRRPSENGVLGRLKQLLGLRASGLVAAIIITMVVFGTINPLFLSQSNLLGLLRAMGTFAIVALGQTLVLVSGELDLSIGAVYGLSAMVAGVLWINLGWPVWLALLAGLIAGIAVGLANAFFTTVAKVPSFITTLGMLSLAQGLTFLISGQQSISASSTRQGSEFDIFKAVGGSRLVGDVPVHIVWLLAVAVIVGYLLHRSLFGFQLAAIGGNLEGARIAGLPVRRYKFWVFGLSGLFAGLGGILDFSFIGSTNPTAGEALTFPVFAAVIIGGASLSGGRGSVFGTLAGAFLLTMLSNGLSLLGVGAFAQLIFVGAVTIGAVGLDQWTLRRRGESGVLQM